MNPMHLVIHQALRPFVRERIFGTFQPDDQTGIIARPDVVHVSIAIHIETFAMDKTMLAVVIQDDLLPIRTNKQPGLSRTIADHIGLAIAREIGRDGRDGVCSLMDDVLFPKRCSFVGRRRHGRQ